MKFRFCLAFLFAFALSSLATAQSSSSGPLLLRNPSLSRDKIAFLYADDVWTVSRQGGEAVRLTSNGHVEAGPFFSPDGSAIAYSAHLEGNTDVYVVPAEGGVPRRVTWHPQGSVVAGWTPDGSRLLVASTALSYRFFLKLFLVHATDRACLSRFHFRLPLRDPFRRMANRSPITRLQDGKTLGNAMSEDRPHPSGS